MKISPSPGRETMVGRKSESLSSLFQGLIRHLGISTSPLRAQLAGKGLGFVHRGGERTFCSLLSCCVNCFALSLLGPASRDSKERLRFAGEASHHRRGEPKGPGAHQPELPPPPAAACVRRNRQEAVFPENLFSRSPGILPLLSLHASSFYEAASFPRSPLPLPFLSLTHRDFIYLFITLLLSPGCLSSASA